MGCPPTKLMIELLQGSIKMHDIQSEFILRTRVKRLVRRTICFSKTERMHDLVIGLFVNRYEFGRAI
jgi:IS1 family transposase